jgi:hypothetical protein
LVEHHVIPLLLNAETRDKLEETILIGEVNECEFHILSIAFTAAGRTLKAEILQCLEVQQLK